MGNTIRALLYAMGKKRSSNKTSNKISNTRLVKKYYIKPQILIIPLARETHLLTGSNAQDKDAFEKKDEYTDSPQLSKPWDISQPLQFGDDAEDTFW